jgi:hypothetical protein
MVTVFHVNDWAMTFCAHPAPKPESLLKVAEIDGDLNDAYHLTQNIDDAWAHTDNPKVRFNAPPGFSPEDCGARSTSVGDVMEMDGVFYVVASVGFDVLDDYSIPVKA